MPDFSDTLYKVQFLKIVGPPPESWFLAEAILLVAAELYVQYLAITGDLISMYSKANLCTKKKLLQWVDLYFKFY